MRRPCVLVFAGSDPSGGAGLQADIQAIAALGAHALTVTTALTVQDNDRVYSVHPVPAALIAQQAQALTNKFDIAAVKIGIVGNRANAEAIANGIQALRQNKPELPVILDTVLASGRGDALSAEDAVQSLMPLMQVATLITPNLPEASLLCGGEHRLDAQAERLQSHCPQVLIKGGHGDGPDIVNRWFGTGNQCAWTWPRIQGQFHGTGCTLASAIAALLAQGRDMACAIETAQCYVHQALASSYAIADGQRIPSRNIAPKEYT